MSMMIEKQQLNNMNYKRSNYIPIIVSFIAMVFGIIAVCTACYRTDNLDFDYLGVIVGMQSLITALLIGWHIYNYTLAEKIVTKVINRSIDEQNVIFERKYNELTDDVSHVMTGMPKLLIAQETVNWGAPTQAIQILFEGLREILQCNNDNLSKDIINSTIGHIKEIFENREKEGKLRIFRGRRDEYLEIINKTDTQDKAELINYINKADEIDESFDEVDETLTY